MLFQLIRINAILDSNKISRVPVKNIRGFKLYIKVRSKKDIKELQKVSKFIDIEGIYTKLSKILQTDIIKELTDIGEFKILLHIDVNNVQNVIQEFINSITYVHEVIPIIDIYRSVDSLKVINLNTINSIVLNYRPLDECRRVSIKKMSINVTYLRDCLNKMLRFRDISLGSIFSRLDIRIYDIVKDLIVLSSSVYVYNSIEDLILIQNIIDKISSPSQLYQLLTQAYCTGTVKVEVNIE